MSCPSATQLELMPCIFYMWVTEDVDHMKMFPIQLWEERWGVLVGADTALISSVEGSDTLCIEIFNSIPHSLTILKNKKTKFKVALINT